jgi:predicted metal-binding protein
MKLDVGNILGLFLFKSKCNICLHILLRKCHEMNYSSIVSHWISIRIISLMELAFSLAIPSL